MYKAPTRALIVEDIPAWVYILTRAARYAGASEIVARTDLKGVEEALRSVRFDVALIDVGLDPHDDVNSDGVQALALIRRADGQHTKCVLVTGWQGGDRMSLQADVAARYGVDGAYMKEKYDARSVITKLTELLEGRDVARSVDGTDAPTPMADLRGGQDPFAFEASLLAALKPNGGVQPLYRLTHRLVGEALPLVAQASGASMTVRRSGDVVGAFWSRALGTAVAVALMPEAAAPADARDTDEDPYGQAIAAMFAPTEVPVLLSRVREKNLVGLLYELPGLSRDNFRD